jgi:hypothetical protein
MEPEKVEYAVVIQPKDYALIAFLNGGEFPEIDNDGAYFAFEIKDGEITNKQIATSNDLKGWMRISFKTTIPGPVRFNRIWR